MVKKWYESHMDETPVQKCRSHLALLNLMLWIVENDDRPDLALMSDQELQAKEEEQRLRAVIEAFRDSPEDVAYIASKFGHRLVSDDVAAV